MAKLPRTFPAPGGCPVIPSGKSHSCISFCVTDTGRTSLCIHTKKTYFMEETSERELQKPRAGELRCRAHRLAAAGPWSSPSCSLLQCLLRTGVLSTSGLELRSSLESGMHSRRSLPNPRSTVLLAVAPYHSSAAATWSVDNKRKSCLDLPFYTSVSKWHL